MILPKDILVRSSKRLAIQAAEMASESAEFREELITLGVSNDMPFSSRAAWSLLSLAESNPELIIPHIKLLQNKLKSLENHTQIASILRLFDVLKPDLEECGLLFDYCLHILRVPLEREYTRAISMNILLKFAKAYPELIPEIEEQIKDALPIFNANHAKRKANQVLKILGHKKNV